MNIGTKVVLKADFDVDGFEADGSRRAKPGSTVMTVHATEMRKPGKDYIVDQVGSVCDWIDAAGVPHREWYLNDALEWVN